MGNLTGSLKRKLNDIEFMIPVYIVLFYLLVVALVLTGALGE